MVTDFVLLEEGTRNIATVHVETDDKQSFQMFNFGCTLLDDRTCSTQKLIAEVCSKSSLLK